MSRSGKFRASKREDLLKWLRASAEYSDHSFEDPGYSEHYKSYFSIFCDDDTYVRDDLDHQLNIGHYEGVYDNYELDEVDDNLLQYVDFVPTNLSNAELEGMVEAYPIEDRDHAREILSREGVVILPGSNQSNANYLYKKLRNALINVREFSVPYVGKGRFKPSYRRVKLHLSKQSVYNFIYSVSTTDHRLGRMSSLLNLDIELEKNASNRVAKHTNQRNPRTLSPGDIRELEMIEKTIERLMYEIDRYYEVISWIWDDILVPFMHSNDCNTMRYLSESDKWVFEKYMTSQPIFSVITTSMQKLRTREINLTYA